MDHKQVTKLLSSEIQSFSEMGLFKKLHDGSLPRSVVADLFHQYEIISNHFPQVLCILGARITSDEVRSGIIQNLWDEHGQGDPRNSHRKMLSRFLDSFFGSDRQPEMTASWQTALFANGVSGICNYASFPEAVGSMIFFEAITPSEYRPIITWLKSNTDLDDNEIDFWQDHIEHDGDHVRDLIESTLKGSKTDPTMIARGIAQASHLERVFWGQFCT